MEEGKEKSSRLKRPLSDDDSDAPPAQRRPRFPKGKKAKKGEDATFSRGEDEEPIPHGTDAQLVAKERARRRNQMREEELFRDQAAADVAAAEVHYEDNATFEEDGIRIEPFNLKQEREEGYFDANGNFVEYASHEIKDAWLDSVEVDTRLAEKHQEKLDAEEDYEDLSSEDIGKIKRNIADLLQPEETIIQALKRLKGTSSDRRGHMSEVTKRMFDQLTEFAVKLMENGEYNVYHEEREIFEREAEGYERLARAREGTSASANNCSSDLKHGLDILSNGTEHGLGESSIWDDSGPLQGNASAFQVSSSAGGDDTFDMFGDDDESTDVTQQHDGSAIDCSVTSDKISQPTSGSLNSFQDLDSGETGDGGLRSDYVYDPSSGYYYSSSLGYYYDPGSGLYCCAATGSWYSYDEQAGTYSEIRNVATVEN